MSRGGVGGGAGIGVTVQGGSSGAAHLVRVTLDLGVVGRVEVDLDALLRLALRRDRRVARREPLLFLLLQGWDQCRRRRLRRVLELAHVLGDGSVPAVEGEGGSEGEAQGGGEDEWWA